jgi:hypothetical protein
MLGAREERADVRTEVSLAPHGDGVERSAVKGIPPGDGLETAGHDSGQLEGHADGGRAAGGAQDAAEIGGSKLGQALGELNGGQVRVTAGTE